MRKVTVVPAEAQPAEGDKERLVTLLATGLRRFLDKSDGTMAAIVDFCADESVTTTCPEESGGEEPGA